MTQHSQLSNAGNSFFCWELISYVMSYSLKFFNPHMSKTPSASWIYTFKAYKIACKNSNHFYLMSRKQIFILIKRN